jgi:hypothetical protein
MKYFSSSHNRGKNLRPPDLYEYFVDNFWFKTIDLENQKLNEPLRGSHQADEPITSEVNFQISISSCWKVLAAVTAPAGAMGDSVSPLT